jgi:hypothetical protein
MRPSVPRRRRSGRLVAALRGLDEREHVLRLARAQQVDRVGVAVDDLLEERLAVLVGRQRALRPARARR